MTNSTLNLSAAMQEALNNFTYSDKLASCYDSAGRMSIECINKHICPQIPAYFVKTGFWIVVVYIVVTWLLWWFMNHGYKLLKYENDDLETSLKAFVGDFRELDTRIYWDTFIRDKLTKLLIGFVVVMVYMFWKM